MGVVRKTISLSEEDDLWVKSQVASGKYMSESEVHRAAIQRVIEAEKYKAAILSKIKAGQESGYSDATFEEIVERGTSHAKTELANREKGAA